jgi:uncharacterized metal-binding protein
VPSGRVHELINLTALGLGAFVWELEAPFTVNPQLELSFLAGYLIGTFLVTPDLDLAEGHVRAKRHWGPLGWLWIPYGLAFSHRGWSHTWLMGPLTRIIYIILLSLVLWGMLEALAQHFGLRLTPPHLNPPQQLVASLVLGYYLSQWLHLMADGIWPDRHRSRR